MLKYSSYCTSLVLSKLSACIHNSIVQILLDEHCSSEKCCPVNYCCFHSDFYFWFAGIVAYIFTCKGLELIVHNGFWEWCVVQWKSKLFMLEKHKPKPVFSRDWAVREQEQGSMSEVQMMMAMWQILWKQSR